MAVVSIPGQRLTLYDEAAIARYLAGIGIEYERLPLTDPLTPQVEALKNTRSIFRSRRDRRYRGYAGTRRDAGAFRPGTLAR